MHARNETRGAEAPLLHDIREGFTPWASKASRSAIDLIASRLVAQPIGDTTTTNDLTDGLAGLKACRADLKAAHRAATRVAPRLTGARHTRALERWQRRSPTRSPSASACASWSRAIRAAPGRCLVLVGMPFSSV
jgi:hypothetical protein